MILMLSAHSDIDDKQNNAFVRANAIVSIFAIILTLIQEVDRANILKHLLRQLEGDAVFGLVRAGLLFIPFET
jgi:hypothetical protein